MFLRTKRTRLGTSGCATNEPSDSGEVVLPEDVGLFPRGASGLQVVVDINIWDLVRATNCTRTTGRWEEKNEAARDGVIAEDGRPWCVDLPYGFPTVRVHGELHRTSSTAAWSREHLVLVSKTWADASYAATETPRSSPPVVAAVRIQRSEGEDPVDNSIIRPEKVLLLFDPGGVAELQALANNSYAKPHHTAHPVHNAGINHVDLVAFQPIPGTTSCTRTGRWDGNEARRDGVIAEDGRPWRFDLSYGLPTAPAHGRLHRSSDAAAWSREHLVLMRETWADASYAATGGPRSPPVLAAVRLRPKGPGLLLLYPCSVLSKWFP